MTWQKGQSGNPNGRPKNGKTLTEALRKHLDKLGNKEELICAIWSLAVGHWVQETDKAGKEHIYLASPDWHALALIFDRLEGKVPVKVDIEPRIRRLAEEYGLDPDEAVRTAEHIMAGAREGSL
jgi:hypothetical protein